MIFELRRVVLTCLSMEPPLPEVGGVVYKATACVSNGSETHPGMRVIHFWLHFQAFFKLSQLGRSVAAVSRFRIILSVIAF